MKSLVQLTFNIFGRRGYVRKQIQSEKIKEKVHRIKIATISITYDPRLFGIIFPFGLHAIHSKVIDYASPTRIF